ncbi:MAG: hypothetical protein V4492_04195 [Chlamydiota bacterium]
MLNFNPAGVPPGTDSFFQSKQFGENELGFLSALMNADLKAQEKSLAEIQASNSATTSIFDVDSSI